MQLIVRLAGWFLSALGLLSLIDDASLLKISGQAEAWLISFRRVTNAIQQLFSWFEWRWMKIEHYEVDCLVIATAFISALMRAFIRSNPRYLEYPTSVVSLSVSVSLLIVIFFFWFIPCFFMPGVFGVLLTTAITAANVLPTFFRRLSWGRNEPPWARIFVEELCGVFAVAAAAVIVSEMTS